MDLEEIRKNNVDTVIRLRVGASGSLMWTLSSVMKLCEEGRGDFRTSG
jgi:hypothetical protein